MVVRFALLLVSLGLFMPWAAHGQNLVPNGSFEEFTTECVFGYSYYDLADWTLPDCGATPGLRDTCNANTQQAAHGGTSYTGIWTLRMNSSGGFPDGNPQQYPSIDLMQPLVGGQYYCLRLWMTMADSSNYRTGALHAFLWYGVPSVCAYNDTAWDTYAAVTFDITAVDTSGWTMLEGGFIASGSESNLTLGAFQFDEEIDSVLIHHDFEGEGDLAVYFIDDVELWACEVGVGETITSAGLKVYPNPVQDVLGFTVPEPGVAAVEVRDALGRSVFAETLAGLPLGAGRHEVNVSRLAPGRYLMRGWIRDGGVLTEGFVVVR